ncbi:MULTISPECIES: tRNA lysidine(34) synthetase TilS [unclassified Chelatococcus]|uniref:tRNA lysidine(34) synthetase TilS n=1 Tax=unclassified Chelatococcus TaxID=2638111 RepID=UPI001BCC5DEE|nr:MULTISPECIES: tRNA lysidine(34) synthetase TilS [unclassified Chelatococcus]MBS7696628.1 tRNA lysidine(34) synthetase TilS [Chelatococcus sp. YT9]MBX3555193.1 tRNA lysidine(34) synthetase TilS [Chelatococcus sp.]
MSARTLRGSVHASNVPDTPGKVLSGSVQAFAAAPDRDSSELDGPLPAFPDDEVAALLAPLRGAKGIVLAVSGGPDSLALLLLAWRWRSLVAAPPMIVASVDHALRPGSADEVAVVAAQSARFGLDHRSLRWEGPKPVTGIHEAARAERYRLLERAVRDAGATHLATAHHADDQAETVLLRLARGSGIGGLGAMRFASPLSPGVTLARPLLGLPKARLVTLVKAVGLSAIDDPSNRDPRFARAILRGQAAARETLGLTSSRLVSLARRAARADDAIERATDDAARRCELTDAGAAMAEVRLSPAFFLEPEEVQLRLLRRGIARMAGSLADGPHLRLERLEALTEALSAARARGEALKRTLGGAVIRLSRSGHIHMSGEGPRRRGKIRNI